MLADSLIVKGKVFVNLPFREYRKLKDAIIEFMKAEGYDFISPFSLFHEFLSLTFTLRFPNEVPISLRIKKFLNIIDHTKFREKVYFYYLLRVRNDVPFELTILLYPGKMKRKDGIILEITAKPTIYFKLTQLHTKTKLISEEDYSFIIFENKEFIKKIARSIGGYIVEEPKPLLEYVKSEVSEKLRKFEFDRLAKILEESKAKIETGKIKEGMDDLRGFIENFFFELVSRTGEKPKSRDQPEKNLEILEKVGYISGEIKGLIYSSLINGVYRKILSEKHHKRESSDLFTARLCVKIVENVVDILLELVYHYKIKIRNNEGVP